MGKYVFQYSLTEYYEKVYEAKDEAAARDMFDNDHNLFDEDPDYSELTLLETKEN